jgi:hypothetical protein
MNPASASQTPTRAGTSGSYEDWLDADLQSCGGQRALVVSAGSLEPAPPVDESLDALYLDRVLRMSSLVPSLARAHRALVPGGRLVVAVDPAEFKFAPLPAGGDVQLLGRLLTDAGFCRVELAHRSAHAIVVTAHRAERDR